MKYLQLQQRHQLAALVLVVVVLTSARTALGLTAPIPHALSMHTPPPHADLANLIRRHGYGVEHHFVTTNDGYVLGLSRVLPTTSEPDATRPRPPVILEHGLLDRYGIEFGIDSRLARTVCDPPDPPPAHTIRLTHVASPLLLLHRSPAGRHGSSTARRKAWGSSSSTGATMSGSQTLAARPTLEITRASRPSRKSSGTSRWTIWPSTIFPRLSTTCDGISDTKTTADALLDSSPTLRAAPSRWRHSHRALCNRITYRRW